MLTHPQGFPLAFDDFGSGTPVVLLHGFPLSRAMWRPQVEPLVDAGFRVILPDLRGFGDSGGSIESGMDDYVDDLVLLFDYLGIEKAVVGGMSMGGYVLFNLLERFPQRVSGAMFIVTRAAADDETGRQKRNELIDAVQSGDRLAVPDTFAGVLFAETTPDENPQLVAEVRQWMESTGPQGLVGGLVAMRERADYAERLEQFRLPSLVVGADRDRAVPLEHYEVLMERLPDAEGTVLVGAGHMANLEKPQPFNRALARFLEQFRT